MVHFITEMVNTRLFDQALGLDAWAVRVSAISRTLGWNENPWIRLHWNSEMSFSVRDMGCKEQENSWVMVWVSPSQEGKRVFDVNFYSLMMEIERATEWWVDLGDDSSAWVREFCLFCPYLWGRSQEEAFLSWKGFRDCFTVKRIWWWICSWLEEDTVGKIWGDTGEETKSEVGCFPTKDMQTPPSGVANLT